MWVHTVQASPYDAIKERSLLPQNWGHFRSSVEPMDFSISSVDERLKRNVEFWIKIYTQYTTAQGLLHDAKYVDKVFATIDVSGAHGMRRAREAKKHWREVLLSLHRKTRGGKVILDDAAPLSDDEKHVYGLFRDIQDPAKFLNAAHRKRLRFQLGQRDRFLDGLKQSGRYLKHMEEIFAREGMPVELTRLPFVESSFNVRARSKVGASGIWQFMRSTAKLFMRVNDAVDERNDPIRATEAAARLLRLNFESLGSWPLAVTAYNHGRKGMMRAVRKVGSDDLEDLVDEYRSRSFGFASSNFFTELLAAIEVERHAEKYFGAVERDAPRVAAEVVIPDFIAFRDLIGFQKLDEKHMRELNPGLSEQVVKGRRPIPAGYRMRIPVDPTQSGGADEAVNAFLAGYDAIPGLYKSRDAHRRIGSISQKVR